VIPRVIPNRRFLRTNETSAIGAIFKNSLDMSQMRQNKKRSKRMIGDFKSDASACFATRPE